MALERINLVPQKPFAEKMKGKIPFFLGFLAVLVVCTLYVQHLSLAGKVEKNRQEIATMEKAITGLTEFRKELGEKTRLVNTLTEQHKTLLDEVTALENQVYYKRRYSVALAGIAAAQPPSVLCRRISFADNSIAINGEAKGYDDLPFFVERLKQNGQFKMVNLQGVSKKKTDAGNLFEFNISGEFAENSI